MNSLPLGVCFALAAATGPAPVFVPAPHFTLAWMHSIEKVRWEEDYEVHAGQAPGQRPLLALVAARVRGSAAGMEPPSDARLRNGWYEYRPTIAPAPELALTRSPYAADYELCFEGTCRALETIIPSDGGITRMYACVPHHSADGGSFPWQHNTVR